MDKKHEKHEKNHTTLVIGYKMWREIVFFGNLHVRHAPSTPELSTMKMLCED